MIFFLLTTAIAAFYVFFSIELDAPKSFLWLHEALLLGIFTFGVFYRRRSGTHPYYYMLTSAGLLWISWYFWIQLPTCPFGFGISSFVANIVLTALIPFIALLAVLRRFYSNDKHGT